ncbi:hypothetical protein MMC19_007635 [Ptychographa xylographoides]|nr:hypothetical protein [Ptychographa xylographoides]
MLLRQYVRPRTRFVFVQGYARRHCLNHRRPNSTTSSPTSVTASQPSSPSPRVSSTSPPRPFPLRTLIYSTLSVLIGLTAGTYVRTYIVPPPLPIPSSAEDIAASSLLHTAASNLAIVKELRSLPDEWREYDAYENLPIERKAKSLTAGSEVGSRGLGVQRVFWNEKEGRTISVVYFGGALSGWPGVVHGGAIATVLLENLERVAGHHRGGGIGVKSDGVAETMGLKYLKPTLANRFHVIRAEAEAEDGARKGESGRLSVKATIESAEGAVVSVSATAQCNFSEEASIVGAGSSATKEVTSVLDSWYHAIKSAFS